MRIGIMSDTHGDERRTTRAAAQLLEMGAEVIVHCGDVGSEGVLTALATACQGVHVHVVLGNVDLWSSELLNFPAGLGVTLHGRVADLELGGRRIAVLHGDDGRAMHAALMSGAYSYIFSGHTHSRSDTRVGAVRMINPGAIHRANPPSAALLDTVTGNLDWIEIAR